MFEIKLFSLTSNGDISKNHKHEQIIFLLTNLYLLYLYNLTKNKLFLIIFMVSSLFHGSQYCFGVNHKITTFFLKLDMLVVYIAAIYILCTCFNKINLKIILLACLAIYLVGIKHEKLYIYAHGLFHFVGGYTLYLLLK